MLQYILSPDDRYSMAELAQMAIEGGCQWISVNAPALDESALAAELAPDVVEMCREAGVFLTVDDRPDTARSLGLHGIRISRDFQLANPTSTPMALREELGPEAVIGVETADPSAVGSMMAADIDFVSLPASFGQEARQSFVRALRDSGIALPVVAQGDFSPAEARRAIDDGCNGVAVGKAITSAGDPVEAVVEIIKAIS